MAKNTPSSLSEGSYFHGKFIVPGALKIEGKFEGKLLQVEQLTIGAKGKVKCQIQAGSVVVEGTVVGNIQAKHRVMLLSSAKILGDIRSPELIIQNGVHWEGKCLVSPESLDSLKEKIETDYTQDGLVLEKSFPKVPNSKD